MAWRTNLPIDLVLVRHGESEGNVYDKMREGGKRSKLNSRHTSEYRLTDLGRLQAQRAGTIIKREIGSFDHMYCSEYVRAIETAGHMDLPGSQFRTDSSIREIHSGSNRGIEHPLKEHGEALAHLSCGAWWAPHGGIGGESFADLCLRLRSFLDHLQESAAGLRVLVVCHAHVIRAFAALLEDKKSPEFEKLLAWKIPNCHIRWYTRREATSLIHLRPFKVITLDMEAPLSQGRNDAACVRHEMLIQRPLLTAEQLREHAATVPQLLNNQDVEDEGPSEKSADVPQ